MKLFNYSDVKDHNINKSKVQQGFVKSIETYRKHAIVQEAIASRLVNELLRTKNLNFNKVLEIGCGPAVLTEKFFKNFCSKTYIANDIVGEYEKVIESRISFLCGDIESIGIPTNLDLVISSSTFQWINNLEELLVKIYNCLSPDAYLVFSTFGPGNFREIKEVVGKGLMYLSYGKIEDILSKKFEIVWGDKETITKYFANPYGILQHMKQTGVNGIPGKAWTKSDLKKFEENYIDIFGTELGVPLTYQPMYFIAKPLKSV